MDGPSVVIVEPHGDTRELYAEYLQMRGFIVVAVEMPLYALAHTKNADAIVTGLAIPAITDGIRFITQIRKNNAAHTPILVVTAHAFEADRQQALAAGADVFLAKPCMPDVLARELRRVITRTRARKRSASAPRRSGVRTRAVVKP